MSSAQGIGDDQLQELTRREPRAGFSPREIVLLRYADAITRSDEDVSDALFAELREHLDEQQVIEATFAIALENMLSKFHRALRIPSDNFHGETLEAAPPDPA